MKKVIISYPFLFYSLYQYYRTKWEFSQDWPQGWAVVALSMLLALLVKSVELTFAKMDIISLDQTEVFSWLPGILQSAWALILALLLNFFFFFIVKDWRTYVKRYDSFPTDIKRRSHLASCAVFSTVMIVCFVRIFTFS